MFELFADIIDFVRTLFERFMPVKCADIRETI